MECYCKLLLQSIRLKSHRQIFNKRSFLNSLLLRPVILHLEVIELCTEHRVRERPPEPRIEYYGYVQVDGPSSYRIIQLAQIAARYHHIYRLLVDELKRLVRIYR